LQNVIERFVILMSGRVSSIDEEWPSREIYRPAARSEASAGFTDEVKPRGEPEIIEVALAETRGRLSSPSGEASNSRIQR
jgi:DNA-binding NtrC family response regulator